MGTFTKKTHCQPMPVVMIPPTRGPTATAAPVTAPNTPNATPRSRPRNAWASRARDVANIIAPPTPCTARARLSVSGLEESPQTAEESVNTTRPAAKMRRRPKRSASEPEVSSSAARVSAYALTTHWRSAKDECRSCWIEGSATFTTVMSRSSMKIATDTAINVHHLRSTAALPSLVVCGVRPGLARPARWEARAVCGARACVSRRAPP